MNIITAKKSKRRIDNHVQLKRVNTTEENNPFCQGGF